MSLDYLGYELKELKATDNSGGGVFSGYASTWEKDLYDDVIVKGAFEQTLSADFKAGGAGISVGRNVFQHPSRVNLVKALRAIVHENASVDQAITMVGE